MTNKLRLLGSKARMLLVGLMVLVPAGSVCAQSPRPASPLPFEEKFSNYHKGNWRFSDGEAGWTSGPIQVEGCETVRVSFDANQKGEGGSDGENMFRVWYEFDDGAVRGDFLSESGEFAGCEISQNVPVRGRTMQIKLEARSASAAMTYFFDNLRVESPEQGLVIPTPAWSRAERPPALPPADVSSGVIRYPTLPGHRESATYVVEVNGETIPVEESWGGLNALVDPTARDFRVAVARLALDFERVDSAAISIRMPASVERWTISPRNPEAYGRPEAPLHRDHEVAGNVLRFQLEEARHLMVQVNDWEYLLLLIDEPEKDAPRLGEGGVVNLADYLPDDRDPLADVTTAVQRAIDETAAAGRILFVPDGLYLTGQLVVRSQSRLYLSSGALLQAIPVWNRQLWPGQAGANDTNLDSSYIFIGDPDDATRPVENVRIYGRGVIDGNGWRMRYHNDSSLVTANVKLFRSASAHGVVVEDVYFRDSARWSFNVLGSRDVRFSNVKLVNCMVGYWGNWTNDQHFARDGGGDRMFHIPVVTNLDGYDIDASTHVLVEDGLVFTGDDAFTPKVTGYMGLIAPCREVVMRRNLIWSEKAALKIGPEAFDDLQDMTFSDNDIVRADRFLSLRLGSRPGVTLSDVRVLRNRVEGIHDNAYERYFRFQMAYPGAIRDVRVDGVDALMPAPQFSSSEGFDANNRVGPVELRNIRVQGELWDRERLFGPARTIEHSDLKIVATPGGDP